MMLCSLLQTLKVLIETHNAAFEIVVLTCRYRSHLAVRNDLVCLCGALVLC